MSDKKPMGPAVIRPLEVAEETTLDRVLYRYVPAWVVSGVLHTLLVAVVMISGLVGGKNVNGAAAEPIVASAVEDEQEPEQPPFNEDIGIDPDIPAATESMRQEDTNVEAPDNLNEAVGITQDTMMEAAPITSISGIGQGIDLGSVGAVNDGLLKEGKSGGGGELTIGNLRGGSGATKYLMLKKGGGTNETEAAVARGLNWLARQQIDDGNGMGHWEYDAEHRDAVIAATGMALLPFLAAGETHFPRPKKERPKELEGIPEMPAYHTHVGKGVKYLLKRMGPKGNLAKGSHEMYEHGIATIALCELAGMVGDKDPELKLKATAAAQYIVNAQAKDGSWGYTAASAGGDTSIVGWQVQALKSADIAGLKVVGLKTAMKNAEAFLDSVMTNTKETYNFGYRQKGAGSEACTAVGTLCRMYMGWTPKTPALVRGVEHLKLRPPSGNTVDLYMQYYATQVMHFYEGPDWHKLWNPAMQKTFLGAQVKDGGKDNGSWPPAFGRGFPGRLGVTCMSLLTLEVYYRHLPLYDRAKFQGGGLLND
jgi:hypothetical protein